MSQQKLSKSTDEQLIEAALFTSEKPLTVKKIKQLLFSSAPVSVKKIQSIINKLQQDYANRGVHLVELASGYRFQTAPQLSERLSLLLSDKPVKISQATLETLALIAYKQPITRGEIEDIRGVSVSSQIIKSLSEREWIKITGHREVPGRPALYATTARFLDYFSLTSLAQLPQVMPIAEFSSSEDSPQPQETEA